MFFCGISGEPPQDPVVSAKSGHVYDRRLILKYINDNGTDPLTGEKLEESDLLAIKANPKAAPPRPPTATSYPRPPPYPSKRELSYALYAQDAASRVVARLIRERDAAREALANVQASMGISPAPTNGPDVEMTEETPPAALPKHVVDQIEETQHSLSATRKKRKAPAGYATAVEVKTFVAKQTIPSLHSASPTGMNSIAISRANPSQFLTGGNDKIVQLYDRSTDKVLASLKGHTKKVNHVAFRERDGDPTLLFSAGADKIAKIWSHDSTSGEYLPKATIKTHKGDLTGLVIHPTSTLVAYSSLDKTYSLHDLSDFSQVYHSAPADEPITSLAIHPDGALLALGTPSSKIQITDVRTGALAATISPEGAPFSVHTLSFSENGYHLLSPDSPSSVAIWDLRKMTAAHSISLGDTFKVNKVVYDYSANFFGVAGNEGVRVFAHKSWEELVRFEEAGDATDLVFSNHGKELWATSGREVRIWGVPE
ncbi:nuclear matrix protein [Chiua virens]|nr:nuclear matrix protein [Chiua virens]